MNVIYISFYYPEARMIDDLLKLGSVVDFPGYTFQSALLSGLDVYYPKLKVISSAFMSAYPKNKRVFFPRQRFSHNADSNRRDIFTGLLNLPGIKELSKLFRVRREIKKSIVKSEKNILICYEAHTPFLLAIASLRKRISKTCLIVPDLPEFMTGRTNKFYLFAKRIDKRIIDFCMKAFDCYVLFSPYMREKINIRNKPWVQLEGIYKGTPILTDEIKSEYKTILYTGNLGTRTGVCDLLDAFRLIESPDYRLWIRGNGAKMKEEILRRQKTDSRIVYFGPMSKEDIIRLQRRATVLVNPIRPSQQQTRYFFPSKTMEYLASGTPTIMYKLDCLPEEYYKHVFFVEKETVESLRDKIIEICEMDNTSRSEFGKKASDFIIQEKNPNKQAGKIVNLINSV